MKPSGANGTRFPLIGLGCLAAALLGTAVLCQANLAAAADDSRGAPVFPVVPGNAVDRPVPEVAPGGTLVLRGTRPVSPSPTPPNPGGGAPSIGAVANGPAAAAYSAPGWDQRFDYSGLDWGPPGPVIGVVGQ
jgi:hypothetical protein